MKGHTPFLPKKLLKLYLYIFPFRNVIELLPSQQNPNVVMLNFRNLSYEGDGKGEHHMQNGVAHNGTVNDIENDNADVHKMEELNSNGTIGEHVPRDRKDSSRDLSHVFEPSRPNKCRWRCKVTANGIDAWSRILFPLAYGLFIVAYWIIYSANTERSS